VAKSIVTPLIFNQFTILIPIVICHHTAYLPSLLLLINVNQMGYLQFSSTLQGNSNQTSVSVITNKSTLCQKLSKIQYICPHRSGTAFKWRWGLRAPRILQIPFFRNLKGRSLPRVPQSGPQNPAMGVLKSPGTPFRACVRRALWR